MKKRLWASLKISLIISLAVSVLYLAGFFVSWQMRLIDKLFLSAKVDNDIVIVSINDDSLLALGRWPWDRRIHAELLGKIEEASPAVIGLDVNFPEKSDAENDQALVYAIRESGNVVLPVEAKLLIQDSIVSEKFLYPMDIFTSEAKGLGMVNTLPDADGVFRKIPLQAVGKDGREEVHFNKIVAEIFLSNRGLALPEIPTDSKGRMIINFAGSPGAYNTVSAIDVINDKVSNNFFRNKIVLIGATAPSLHDEQLVPTSKGIHMSGVEILANGINTIINENFLVMAPLYAVLALIFLVVFITVFALMFYRVGRAVLGVFALIFLYVITVVIVFDIGIMLDIFYPLLAIVISVITTVAWRYINEAKEKKFIKSVFSRYVSPDVIHDLLSNPHKLKLGGEKKELSILFSDIRGFTTISEKLSPEDLVKLLNEYLSLMTELIMDARGVVDKYIGDAIMAFWGAPLEQPKHAERSCASALDMMMTLKEKQVDWKERYGVDLNIGIGINTGDVIVGNMGSDQRFDYTVMGDVVNLASRLEGITKQYKTSIVVSQFTYEKAKDKYIFRFLDKVAVKGKKTGIEIYELVSAKEDFKEEDMEKIKEFEKGIKIYQGQKWDEAVSFFEKFLEKFPGDGPAEVYLERCQKIKLNPPSADWDGICRMETK